MKFEQNMDLYNSVRSVPEEALKQIKAGRLKEMYDINPQWRIEKLTETFGICGFGWYTETVEEKIIEGGNNEKSAFVKIHLFVKVNGEWSKPIEGKGGSSFVSKEKNGLYTSDECFKMAETDAISVACKKLGIAGDVYRGQYDSKYSATVTGQNQQDKPERTPEEAKKQSIINNILYYICNKDKDKMPEKLEELTSFKTKDGKQIKGKSDITQLSNKQIDFLYNSLSKSYPDILKQIENKTKKE